MRFASAPLVAVTLFAAMGGSMAHAEQLATWSFSGVLGDVRTEYSSNAWQQQLVESAMAEGNDISGYYPLYGDAQRAAMDEAMAPFAVGQAFTLNVVVDLDTPYGPDGVASFPNAIKSQELLIPQAGVSAVNRAMVHQGISITPENYETGIGDVYYFYLPAGYDYLMSSAEPQNIFGGTVYFTDPDGLLNQAPDLHAFATAFDPNKYNYITGGTPVNNAACGGRCGGLGFTIQSASVSIAAVPEPGTWLTMALGLIGVAGATQRRRARQQVG